MRRFDDETWRESMRIQFDFNNIMADYAADSRAAVRSVLRKIARVTAEGENVAAQSAITRLSEPPGRLLRKNFIDRKEFDSIKAELDEAFAAVAANRGNVEKMMAWTELPYNQDDIVATINDLAASVREKFDNFVVFGIGGSALGPLAVQQALNDLHYNELPKERRGGPRLYVEDNVDPERMASLLNLIDVEKTCFNVVSKSGNTSETMSQYLIIMDLLKRRLGDNYKENVIVTTGPALANPEKDGVLRKLVNRDPGIVAFEVPDGVGGRFSEMSAVGLLAAAVTGVDIAEMLKGAAAMDERTKNADPYQNPALYAAGVMVLAMQKGLNIHVMMPYADSLKYFADWYVQLWAESLGKERTREGILRPVGQSPVKALGVTDQHSQLQLYSEGPDDKVITFIRVEKFRRMVTIPVVEGAGEVEFLSGRTLNELINAECQATEYALLKSAKPSWTIVMPEVNAFTIGQLMYFFEMMTAYAGELLDINAFDQPGVEESKLATFAKLNREGFEEKAAEVNAQSDRREEYMFK